MEFDADELRNNIKTVDRMRFAAFMNFQANFQDLVMVVEDDNVANGRTGGNNQKTTRSVDKDSIVNPWAFHTKREQAIRKNVNDKTHEDYDENHEYFRKGAIGRRPKDVPKGSPFENNSIMPIMKKKFNDNKVQIILDMINEKDVFTSKQIKDKENQSYWSKKSPATKNLYINKIKKEYSKNKDIQGLSLVEEPIIQEPANTKTPSVAPTTEAPVGREITVDPSQMQQEEVKDEAVANVGTRLSRRRGRPPANEQETANAKSQKTEQTGTPKRNTRASAAKNVTHKDDNVTAESTEEGDQPEEDQPEEDASQRLQTGFDDEDNEDLYDDNWEIGFKYQIQVYIIYRKIFNFHFKFSRNFYK